MKMKPLIVVTCSNDSDTLTWASDGWYQMHQHGTPEAEALMVKAHKAIGEATDVLDAVNRLRNAGFEVTRAN